MYSEMKKDLKNGTIEDTCTKYNITFNELFNYCLKNNFLFNRDNDSDKYIYPRGNKFTILKRINDKFTYYGLYGTLKDARMVRDKLVECDWDMAQLHSIITELGIKEQGGENSYESSK